MYALLVAFALAGKIFAQPSQISSCSVEVPDYHKGAGVLKYVNPLIGTYGTNPDGNGGMIPSVAPPFAMTRWTPQTRENFISQVPFSDSDRRIHGFQATHQPAIWMGESGQVVLTPGMGDVQPLFQNRGLAFRKQDERSSPYVYEVLLDATQLLDHDWNATAEAAGDGPVPGGIGAVPDTVSQGANRRTKKRQVQREISASDTAGQDSYSHSIQVPSPDTSLPLSTHKKYSKILTRLLCPQILTQAISGLTF